MDPVVAGLLLVLAALLGVVVGAITSPLNQLYLDRKREERATQRAKLLVAGELLQIQTAYNAAASARRWTPVEDLGTLLPTAAWQMAGPALASVHGPAGDDDPARLMPCVPVALSAKRKGPPNCWC